MLRKVLSNHVRRTTLTFSLCLAFLLGVGIAHCGLQVTGIWVCVAFIPLVAGIRRRNWLAIVWIVIFGLLLGWWRGSIYMANLVAYQPYFGHKVTISAIASQDGAYNKYKQMTFDVHSVKITETGQKLKGKVSLGGFGLNAVFAGDEVTATGKLLPSLGSYQGRMSYSQLTLVAHHNTLVNELRRRFTAGVQSSLPEPLASFGMGLLIGQRNTLPDTVSKDLLMVGLTHIIAVSGYNLTILLRSAQKIGGKRSKRLTTLLSFVLIALFLLFAGTSASIVRAAIVSLLSIVAAYYGRPFKPLVLLSLAAAITAFANPFYVWTDTSWYLSFLAFYGVMILAPLISANWPDRCKESLVISVALESICAEAMTLPFILHAFGQMSFIGLLANVLVTALVPLAMLVTMIAGLAGMLLPAMAGWLVWPARVLLTYMLDTAHLLANIPHVFVQNLGFTSLQMLLSYLGIGAFTAVLYFKRKPKNAKITGKADKELEIERTFQMVNHQA